MLINTHPDSCQPCSPQPVKSALRLGLRAALHAALCPGCTAAAGKVHKVVERLTIVMISICKTVLSVLVITYCAHVRTEE